MPLILKRIRILRHLIPSVFFIIASTEWLSAQGQDDSAFAITARVGYHREDLRWSIGGKNSRQQNINVLSELIWKNVSGIRTDVEARFALRRRWIVTTYASKAFFLGGSVTDTDYDEHDRKDIVFHDQFDASKGWTTQYEINMGCRFVVLKQNAITPFIGYGVTHQMMYMLRMFGNVQRDLESTYKTRWKGITAGVNASMHITKDWQAITRIQYEQLSYYAIADWNLIDEFKHPVSFEHRAKGYGIHSMVELKYKVTTKLSITASSIFRQSITGSGRDTLYKANGDVVLTPLNEVRSNSITFLGGLQYSL